LLSKDDLENKYNTFIENVKYYIHRYGKILILIYNSDQSGFQLEMHSGCTLLHKSKKKVEL